MLLGIGEQLCLSNVLQYLSTGNVHLIFPSVDASQVTLLYLGLQGQIPLQLVDATMHLCTGAVLTVAEVIANFHGLT